MTDKGPITTAHCNKCGHGTKHDVLSSTKTEWDDTDGEGYGTHGWDRYEMLQCRGCEGVTMRHTSYFSEEDEPSETQYPPRTARRKPEWRLELWRYEQDIGEWLDEIYVAVQNNSPRLAAMGIRALLEHIMISKVADQGSFAEHVKAFRKAGYVTDKQAEDLSDILEAGHATIHREWTPSARDISTLLDITESIIASIYIHGEKLRAVRKKVPPRKAKTPSGITKISPRAV